MTRGIVYAFDFPFCVHVHRENRVSDVVVTCQVVILLSSRVSQEYKEAPADQITGEQSRGVKVAQIKKK